VQPGTAEPCHTYRSWQRPRGIEVVDNESAITTQAGCGATTINMDTPAAGTTPTCTATSAGGTASQSVTIKRDATAPTVACGSADGLWHASDMSIACTASDGTSGLANATDANFNLATNVANGNNIDTASPGPRPSW
jgi:hypothetical protein